MASSSSVIIDLNGSNAQHNTKNDLSLNTTFPDIIQYLPSDQIVTIIGEHKNDLEFINRSSTQTGYTALHWACIKNDFELVKYLVFDCKADVNLKANMGETPVFICVKNGNFSAFDFLVANGADLTIRDKFDRSIVHWAAYTGRIAIFHYLKKYYQINFNDVDQYGQNPLMIACSTKNGDLARYLIRSNQFDMHHQDCNGNTCLHMAVKSGLPRLTHLICNTAGRSIINTQNKNHQAAIDLISNEYEPVYGRIRSWLKFESTNKSEALSKLYENLHWLAHFSITALFVDIPLILNLILFNENNYTFLKGLVQFGALIPFAFAFSSQSHRINYLNGAMNPFHMGFFVIMFANNYGSFYTIYLPEFSFFNLIHLMYLSLTCLHIYVFIKILRMDAGVVRENCRKANGSDYELRDLLKLSYANDLAINKILDNDRDNENMDEYIFCETCLQVTKKPTKHCKLCEMCHAHFDHHCVFVNKCIALDNHKYFILLLVMTLIGEIVYLPHVFFYFKNIYFNLPPETSSIFSYVLSSTSSAYLTIIAGINASATPMVFGLLLFQLNVVSHGFTQQFRPSNINHMSLSLSQRVDNLRTFFLKSKYDVKKLFERQMDMALKLDSARGYPTDKCDSRDHHGHSHGF